MTPTDTFFHTWLNQIGKNASIKEQIESLQSRLQRDEEDDEGNKEDKESLKASIAKLEAEYANIKDSADGNKKALIDAIEKSENKEIIINPREASEGGLTPHAYRVYLDDGDLKYLTLK